MVVLFSKNPLYVGLNVIFKCRHNCISRVLRYILEKETVSKFFPMDKFYMFLVHVIPCNNLPFSMQHAACSMPSAVAAGNASQTTPVQITHIFVLCYSTQMMCMLF